LESDIDTNNKSDEAAGQGRLRLGRAAVGVNLFFRAPVSFLWNGVAVIVGDAFKYNTRENALATCPI
jgi:hypothetical protein